MDGRSGQKVTLTTRHLVSHLGGIRHYSKDYFQKKDDKENKSPSSAASKPETSDPRSTIKLSAEFDVPEYFLKDHFGSTEAGLALFQDDPLVHKPGSQYLYTSHGWTLIAAVLEGATKRTFPDIAQDLFRDLGLENTYLDDHQPLVYNRSRFYVRNQKNLLVNAPYVDCSHKYAGGGMLSTAPDLIKFGNTMLYSFQFQGLEPRTQRQKAAGSSKEQGNAVKQKVNSEQGSGKNNTVEKEGTVESKKDSVAKSVKHEKRTVPDAKVPGYLKSSTVQKIWAPVTQAKCDWDKDGFYAMGWAVVPEKQNIGFGRHQRFYISHTGGAVGASSVMIIMPPSKDEELGKGGNLCAPPRGVVVAMIVNMISVSLCKTAVKIAKVFEDVVLE